MLRGTTIVSYGRTVGLKRRKCLLGWLVYLEIALYIHTYIRMMGILKWSNNHSKTNNSSLEFSQKTRNIFQCIWREFEYVLCLSMYCKLGLKRIYCGFRTGRIWMRIFGHKLCTFFRTFTRKAAASASKIAAYPQSRFF